MQMNVALYVVSAALLATLAGSASAQQQPPPRPQPKVLGAGQAAPTQPGAQSDSPQRTTATYEDWVVQCETQAGPPPTRVCDMAQITQAEAQGRTNPFSRVAIAHPVKGQPVKLIVQVPVNVQFSTNVHVQTSDSDPGFVAPFARCVPAGCFAEFDVKDDLLKKLYSSTTSGKVSFADAGGHDVSVPLSFKGFDQAYDALAKE
jgi:invasion protein IalB